MFDIETMMLHARRVEANLRQANAEVEKGNGIIRQVAQQRDAATKQKSDLANQVRARDEMIERYQNGFRELQAQWDAMTANLNQASAEVASLRGKLEAEHAAAAAARKEAEALREGLQKQAGATASAKEEAEDMSRALQAVIAAFRKQHPDSPLFDESGWVQPGGYSPSHIEIVVWDATEGVKEAAAEAAQKGI